MTMMPVICKEGGEVINIGAWDYQYVEVSTGILNADGLPIMRLDPSNPLPEGAYQSTADVVTGWDGGLYLADDPRRLAPE